MSQLVEEQGNKTYQKSGKKRQTIGPARWTRARLMYVNGEFQNLSEVVEFLGCAQASVRNRAARERWGADRAKLVERLVKQSESMAGLLKVNPTEAESRSLAETRLVLAQRVLALSDGLLDCYNEQSRLLSRAQTQEPGEVRTALVACLSSARADTLQCLTMLAGLPEPGRMASPAKPVPTTEPARGEINPAMLEPVSGSEAGQVEE